MPDNTHPVEGTRKLSIDELRSLAWTVGHQIAQHSVEYAVATATRWAIDDEAHRRGTCLSDSILCKSLEHIEHDSTHRWRQEANGWEWRCSRCHLWLIGLPQKGRRVYEAMYTDFDFSPHVASRMVKGGRELLFSECDPAESRRQLSIAARAHQESQVTSHTVEG